MPPVLAPDHPQQVPNGSPAPPSHQRIIESAPALLFLGPLDQFIESFASPPPQHHAVNSLVAGVGT
ncbi:hypothetical protein BO78DRAFT_421056 [Aspergillus sclerotiicarbonarius CBS 121057]|uniref:Uncharacterized protein n=1 Tax=Aspergillus sclerotiicarbonarius (strain CBS 121057 / IBT 28362) TaxID=1448318 RepID=A0A319E1V7_ASPSB|nr:hypothetical protein BO78DRAFT_421056 [Aspergillus sclerotiicarbonarius CBS 121057]